MSAAAERWLGAVRREKRGYFSEAQLVSSIDPRTDAP